MIYIIETNIVYKNNIMTEREIEKPLFSLLHNYLPRKYSGVIPKLQLSITS